MKTYDIWKMIDEDYESVAGKKIKLVKMPTAIEKVSVGDIVSIGKNARDIPCLFDKWDWRIQDLTGFEEWEEVKESIGLVELLEKISREGDITVDFEDYKDEYNFKDTSLDKVLLHLSKEFSGDCLAETLLASKWYIKD